MKPVEIGSWTNYTAFANKEQLQEQRDNLIYLPLSNGRSDLCFIYTAYADRLCAAISELAGKIKIINTDVVLENEIYHTSKIEGAKTTRMRTSELHNGAKIRDNDVSENMIVSAFKAVKLLNLHSTITCESLVNVWNVLVEGCCDNEDLRDSLQNPVNNGFRTGEVFIGEWQPPNFIQVPILIQRWVDFYNDVTFDDLPYVKAAILHFSFEIIHPFCDGNGRLGRLLMNNYLISRGIEACRAVSFSMSIDKKRALYDAAFYNAENLYSDCTPFIEFILECMYDAFESADSIEKCNAF